MAPFTLVGLPPPTGGDEAAGHARSTIAICGKPLMAGAARCATTGARFAAPRAGRLALQATPGPRTFSGSAGTRIADEAARVGGSGPFGGVGLESRDRGELREPRPSL